MSTAYICQAILERGREGILPCIHLQKGSLFSSQSWRHRILSPSSFHSYFIYFYFCVQLSCQWLKDKKAQSTTSTENQSSNSIFHSLSLSVLHFARKMWLSVLIVLSVPRRRKLGCVLSTSDSSPLHPPLLLLKSPPPWVTHASCSSSPCHCWMEHLLALFASTSQIYITVLTSASCAFWPSTFASQANGWHFYGRRH